MRKKLDFLWICRKHTLWSLPHMFSSATFSKKKKRIWTLINQRILSVKMAIYYFTRSQSMLMRRLTSSGIKLQWRQKCDMKSLFNSKKIFYQDGAYTWFNMKQDTKQETKFICFWNRDIIETPTLLACFGHIEICVKHISEIFSLCVT